MSDLDAELMMVTGDPRTVASESSVSSSSEEESDGWGEDLKGSTEEARNWFFSQSMLRQEEIIAERYEKRKEAQRRRNIKRRLREKKKQEAKQTRKRVSNRKKESTASSKKRSVLDEYSENRKRSQKRRRKLIPSPELKFDQEIVNDEETEERRPEYDEERGEPAIISEQHVEEDTDQIRTMEELFRITLSKDELLKWIEYPNFNESVVGFFVRVCIGNNRYIIAKIKSVSEYKPSTREIRQTQLPKKNLSKALALDHAGKVKTCPIYQTSSRPFTLEEFETWIRHCRRAGGSDLIPYLADVDELEKKRRDISNFNFTEEIVTKMIRQSSYQGNAAEEKAKLLMERQTLVEAPPTPEITRKIEEIDQKVEELSRVIKKLKSEESEKVALINKKRKQQNFTLTQTKIELEKKASTDLDPFSRRKTRSHFVWHEADSASSYSNSSEINREEINSKEEIANESSDKKSLAEPLPDHTPSSLQDTLRSVHHQIDFDIELEKLGSQNNVAKDTLTQKMTSNLATQPVAVHTQRPSNRLSLRDYKRKYALKQEV